MPSNNANGPWGRERTLPLPPRRDGYSSRFLNLGRKANHHTDTIVAKAPTMPIPDLTPLPFMFSVIHPS